MKCLGEEENEEGLKMKTNVEYRGFLFCKGLSVREVRVYMWENGTDISKVMMVMGVRRNRSRVNSNR